MTKKALKVSPAYVRAAIRRQRYLDFLNDHPGAIAAEIERHMADTYQETAKTTNTTRMLCTLGEAYMVKSAQTNGYRYFAIATVTATAETMALRHMDANAKYNSERVGSGHKAVQVSNEPWRYIHKAGHYDIEGHKQGHPLKAQEGIGSGRSRVYVSNGGMGHGTGMA